MSDENGDGKNVEPQIKRNIIEAFLVYLPIGLVAVGGALGGAIGGVTVWFNMKIAQSNYSGVKRYSLYLATIFGAILFYFIVVTILAIIFPSLFGAS